MKIPLKIGLNGESKLNKLDNTSARRNYDNAGWLSIKIIKDILVKMTDFVKNLRIRGMSSNLADR